ncbi:MAG: endonuclease, partial [Prevotella sp.]|nr:endonuclease [Prevotella sp.]
MKNDLEWLPDGDNHWNKKRYWKKVNHLAQEVIACGETEDGWELPDLVALCEVENDTVMRDLTRRSPLRNARYEYVMTDSPDPRGIDVALMYSPFSFSFIESRSFGVKPLKGMHAPRDILFVKGRLLRGDTLCVFVVHAPSRTGGERATRNHRL